MRSYRTVVAMVLTSAVILVGAASPAQAAPSAPALTKCLNSSVANHTWSVSAPGNLYTETHSSLKIFDKDAFRLAGTGTITIDWWGNWSDVAGLNPVATAEYPLPGERRFMLIGRIKLGKVWVQNRSRYYFANNWFPIGNDSGCLLYEGPSETSSIVNFFQLSYNDPNIGDNGGSPTVAIRQWF